MLMLCFTDSTSILPHELSILNTLALLLIADSADRSYIDGSPDYSDIISVDLILAPVSQLTYTCLITYTDPCAALQFKYTMYYRCPYSYYFCY